MDQNRFWELLAKKLAGEATPEERLELESMARNEPDVVYTAQILEDLWKLPAKKNENAEEAFARHLKKFQEKEGLLPGQAAPFSDEKKKNHFTVYRIPYFAALLLIVAAALWFKWNNTVQAKPLVGAIREISSHPGTQTKLILSDSTVVWLNSDSKVTYDENYGILNRNITLSGEAFFDVRKSQMPFIISTNGIKIRVLGTAFNVRSYANEGKTETSLIRGRVEIRVDQKPDQLYILQPNEKLTVSSIHTVASTAGIEKKQIQVQLAPIKLLKDSLIAETSWILNKLVFEDEPFDQLSKKMEKWFGVSIDILDDKTRSLHFTGTFEKETITQALEALQLTASFHYSIQNKSIRIFR